MKILIVKLSALGDVTYSLPVLTALRRAHPDAQIDWLVDATNADVVLGHPAVNNVLIWRRRQFTADLKSGRWLRAFGELRSFLKQLRATRYDLILDLQALLKSGLWIGLARSKRKVGFGPGMDHSEGSHRFLNERIPAISMEVHALERGLRLLDAIGIPRGPVVHDFPIGEPARAAVSEQLATLGIGPADSVVAIHPMTRWPTKLWLNERFAQVAGELISAGHRVVFTGAPSDSAAIDSILAAMKTPALRLDGKLGLKELAALFERARVVISTDTGPMHMAAAVGTPIVAIFGPTAPNRTGPFGEQHRVLRAGVACSPCFSKQCTRSTAEPMACMNGITSEQVAGTALEILGGRP